MRWVAPTEKDTANETLEQRLWAAADQCNALFEHVYESYMGDGKSSYTEAA